MGDRRVRLETPARMLCAAAALWCSEVTAQDRLVVEPTLAVAQVRDSNVMNTPEDIIADDVTRTTPGLAVSYTSPRWTVEGALSLDHERYASRSDLDDPRARQQMTLTTRLQASPRTSLRLRGSHVETNTLTELNDFSGLSVERRGGRRLSIEPSATFLIGPRMNVSMAYATSSTVADDGARIEQRGPSIVFTREAIGRETLAVEYAHSEATFTGTSSESIVSDVLRASVTRALGANTRMSLKVGPRMTNGAVGPDAMLSLEHDWKTFEGSVSLVRTETTAIGYSGMLTVDGIETRFVSTPGPRFAAEAIASVSTSRAGSLSGTVYRAGVAASYELFDTLALQLTYDVAMQHGGVDLRLAGAEFSRSKLAFGISSRWRSDGRYPASRRSR